MSLFNNLCLENITVDERGFSAPEETNNLLNIISYLYKYAFIDFMTGLKNRNAYEEMVRSLKNNPSKLAGLRVVMIDVDELKSINDNYGHDSGDAAIKTVGKCIAKAFGTGTLTFRYGGDEFICFSYTDISQNIKTFNQLMSLEKFSVNFPLNASIGFAEFDKTIDAGIDALVKRCDDALYLNKTRRKGAFNQRTDFNISVCPFPA